MDTLMVKVRSPRFETASGRLKLPIRKRSYVAARLSKGVFQLYRRCKGPGTWSMKAPNGRGGYWLRAIGVADDYEPPDDSRVLNYYQAGKRALEFVHGDSSKGSDAPVTVAEALAAYARDLKAAGASEYNALSPRRHLEGSPLLNTPVAMLTAKALRAWRDNLLERGHRSKGRVGQPLQPASVRRITVGLKAVLELARKHDPRRILNRDAWETGLATLPNTNHARRLVRPDSDIIKVVDTAWEIDAALGLMVEVDATIGARLSQLARVTVADLQYDDRPDNPRLLVPCSRKGGRKVSKPEHSAAPIPVALARKLKAASEGRPLDAPLLVRGDGSPWGHGSKANHFKSFRAAVTAAGFDPDEFTMYTFRHSGIARALLSGISPVIVARQFDTSLTEIQRHYAHYISDVSDMVSRRGMLSIEAPPAVKMLPAPDEHSEAP
jgi:integrase